MKGFYETVVTDINEYRYQQESSKITQKEIHNFNLMVDIYGTSNKAIFTGRNHKSAYEMLHEVR